MSAKYSRKIILVFLILLNIGCDQFSKEWVRSNVDTHEYIELMGKSFVLTKVENSGAFLGFGSSFHPVLKSILLLGLPVITLLGLIIYLFSFKKLENTFAIAMAFIIGGGIGNLFDRMLYGSVTDFFYIHIGIFKTGIFNMADVSVTTGIVFLLFYQIMINMPKAENKKMTPL
ncbi:signal peptidase II [Ascidiimonas sp. W6]|uniref:signal peptidase II n=1 Tax=Ascidiimonas meishanensis TaxID=3128903 RepID=UPI0030EF2729